MLFGNFLSRRLLVIGLTLAIVPIFAADDKAYAKDGDYRYLALGDSISFGYDPTVAPTSSKKYTGYPQVVADVKRLRNSGSLVNASCPGESSGSFLMFGAPDYGCLSLGPQGQPPFKTAVGLHTDYSGTQLEFAVSELSRRKYNLVTLSLGGNDLLMVASQCPRPYLESCIRPILKPALLAYGANLTQILTVIRGQAGYKGTLVLMNNYVPNADPLFQLAVSDLNKVMALVGSQFGVKTADAFTAFQLAAVLFDRDPCKAGLLVRVSPTTCDVHPSPLGRSILAATVLLAEFKRN